MGVGRAWRGLLTALAILAAPHAGRADDALPQPEPVQVLPAWIFPGGDHSGPPLPALINHPPGWSSGDAAVLLVPGADWPAGAREALREAMLAADAAVLEMAEPPPALLLPQLSDALRALRRDHGAGLVVVIGRGASGQAALGLRDAIRPEDAPPVFSPPFAALIRLGPGAPGFVAGQASRTENWPHRARLLCDLLTAAPLPDVPGLPEACRAALSP